MLVIHTHTHPFNGPFSGTTQVSRYQKGKTNLDFIEARDSEWQRHQLGHMKVCMSLQTDNHASTPQLSFLQAGCPSCRPTNSIKALKVNASNNNLLIMMTSQVAIDTKYLCLQHSSLTLVDDSSTYDSITNIFVGHFLTVIHLENFVLHQALYSFSETCELFVSQETAIIIHNNSTLAIWPQIWVWFSVGCFQMSVCALKGKWLGLSTPTSVDI